MQIVHYKPGIAPIGVRISCALGFFDGVHLGHRRLIEECIKEAKKEKIASAVFTFSSDERRLKGGVARLYSTEEKLSLIEAMGVDYAIVADFPSVSDYTPGDFVKRILVDELNTEIAFSGEGFRFGAGASGDARLLFSLLSSFGRRASIVKDVLYESNTVSSTAIRRALADGDVEYANKLLHFPYFKRGTVKHGLGLGRSFGFPTVNTELPHDNPLKSGVYLTELSIGGACYRALTNVGVCPTFGERERHAETMIADFSGDLYGQTVEIRFLKYLREETRFSSAEELKEQIKKDLEAIG